MYLDTITGIQSANKITNIDHGLFNNETKLLGLSISFTRNKPNSKVIENTILSSADNIPLKAYSQ